MSSHRPWQPKSDAAGLAEAYDALGETGRGKHVGPFSYYHVALVAEVPTADSILTDIRQALLGSPLNYNVLKLDRRSRISFLMYQEFSAPFPVLDLAFSCNIPQGTVRKTDYRRRPNPPILHRKELLLPEDHPLVPAAVRLTEQLESHGAFAYTRAIGTRNGWIARLESLGLSIMDGELQPSP